MRLDLTKIRTAREHYTKVYQPEAFSGQTEGFRIAAPVSLDFEIVKDKRLFRLIGHVKTTVELACGRCLEAFVLPIDASFDLRYQPHADTRGSGGTGDGEREIEEDDLGTAFYEHDEIDLGQLMSEQFYLSLPMKPLCRDDCRGLCAVCGANWNRETCQCASQWEDPRLAVLKVLKKDS